MSTTPEHDTSSLPVQHTLLQDGQVLHLLLNAPKANVLDARMLRALHSAIQVHASSPRLKVIAFEGAGKHFSFGASVEEHQAAQVAGMLEQFHGFFRFLSELAVPTCALVRGQCLGGGLELASYCTWIFSSSDARFAQPEIKLGVFPPMASVLLPWRCGGARGLELCVSGRTVEAEEAQRIGLVFSIDDDPRPAFLRYFDLHLAPLSASSLRFAERAARVGLDQQLRTLLPELERRYTEHLMQTLDANEGIAAFLEKRAPDFVSNRA